MYNSTKAKWNSHAVRRCTSHTTFGVSMERVFGVTVHLELPGLYRILAVPMWRLLPLMSMDADPDMYPILIPPVSNTFYFCHHPQPHHSQPYHAQSIIYHPSFDINGNSWYQAYSITVSIFLIFSRLPSPLCPPLNSVKWSSPQNNSCHRRYSPIQYLSSTMHIFRNEANSPSWW